MPIVNILAIIFSLIFGAAHPASNVTAVPTPPAIASSPNATASSTIADNSSHSPATVSQAKILAECLTKKGVIMYGAYWCPHCQAQKTLFGEDFQYIKYQECDPKGENGNPAACDAAGVKGYPTWKIPGQANIEGEQTFEDLSKAANCPL